MENEVYYRGITGEFNINDGSIEFASNFDDIVYRANEMFGDYDTDMYEYNAENVNRYFERMGFPYHANEDGEFIAFGVNALDNEDDCLDFTACPNATSIVKLECRHIGRNLCDDGYIVKIIKVIEIISK